MKKFILIPVILLLSLAAFPQAFKAKVIDLSFMSGTWKQQHQWGDMEEFWGPPMAII